MLRRWLEVASAARLESTGGSLIPDGSGSLALMDLGPGVGIWFETAAPKGAGSPASALMPTLKGNRFEVMAPSFPPGVEFPDATPWDSMSLMSRSVLKLVLGRNLFADAGSLVSMLDPILAANLVEFANLVGAGSLV